MAARWRRASWSATGITVQNRPSDNPPTGGPGPPGRYVWRTDMDWLSRLPV